MRPGDAMHTGVQFVLPELPTDTHAWPVSFAQKSREYRRWNTNGQAAISAAYCSEQVNADLPVWLLSISCKASPPCKPCMMQGA